MIMLMLTALNMFFHAFVLPGQALRSLGANAWVESCSLVAASVTLVAEAWLLIRAVTDLVCC